jgi:hypothetical protein
MVTVSAADFSHTCHHYSTAPGAVSEAFNGIEYYMLI